MLGVQELEAVVLAGLSAKRRSISWIRIATAAAPDSPIKAWIQTRNRQYRSRGVAR